MHVLLTRWKFPSLLALVLATILFLIGCGSVPSLSDTATPPPDANAKTTLTLWHTLTGARSEALEELARDFSRTYPDLAVDPVFVGTRDDLTKQMTAAIALGSAPDLILADRRQISEFAQQGGLYPLDALMDDPELGLSKQDLADFLPGALQLGKFPALGDRTYGFPFNQEALVLFYNADLLRTININQPPRTWEQFGEYATTVTNDSNYGWVMRSDADSFEAMLVSRGSALLTDRETRALFNERAGLASLRLFADLHKAGIVELATSDDKARAAFAAGDAAFYMGWLSELDILRAAQKEARTNFTIAVAPLPQLDPEFPWLLARGDLFALPRITQGRSLSERARRAWFFVRWITTTTPGARWVRATDALPLRASELTFVAPSAQAAGYGARLIQAFDGAVPRLAPQPAPPHMDAVREQVSGLWLEASQENPDLAAILDAQAERVNQILSVKP